MTRDCIDTLVRSDHLLTKFIGLRKSEQRDDMRSLHQGSEKPESFEERILNNSCDFSKTNTVNI